MCKWPMSLRGAWWNHCGDQPLHDTVALSMSGFGRIVGGHRLVAGLGSGGMARVYLALSLKQFGFTKLVVLKVLREELGTDDEFLEMFMHEARLAARLNHPHVVQTYEVGVDQGIHFIAMEYLEGQSLSATLSRVGLERIPLGFQLRVISDVLEGLHYAHELRDYDGTHIGIVHRDVSPQNVFVTYTGQAKLLDFGIAKTTSSVRTSQGILKGKAGYMAPEQAMSKPPDARADLYAIGVMLWEAIAQRRLVPRTEDDVIALTRRLAGNDPKIREIVPDAPPELADICDKAMEKNPADRWQSAEELRIALQKFIASSCPYESRDVAALLSDAFAEERTRIRKLVEQQQKVGVEDGTLVDLKTGTTVTLPRQSFAPPALLANEPSGHPTSITSESAFASRTGASFREQRSSRMPLVIGAAVVALLGIGFVARATFATKPTETTSTTPATASTERQTYTLHLASEPPGARVYEGEAMLGRTPLDLPINNGGLRAVPRQLLVKLEGHEPYRVDPQPSAIDVETKVTLAKTAAATTTTAAPTGAPVPVPPQVGFAGRPHSVPGKPSTDAPTTPAPTATHRLGVEPASTQDLRPLDTANPWEKK